MGTLGRSAALLLCLAACARGGDGLPEIQTQIEAAMPAVEHVTAAELDGMDDPLLFDVRSEAEFAVSRLPGAVRVDPDMDADAFLAAHGQAAAGRTLVFYCSVGWRSSGLADRVGPALAEAGGRAVNLRGGAFGWVNEGRMLSGPDGPTGRVHAYDRVWGRLIEDEDARVLPDGGIAR